ncbi:MAG: 3-keto-disaccharide hydrolase [Planctomycetota bacterium]|jgi:hypothetical protein
MRRRNSISCVALLILCLVPCGASAAAQASSQAGWIDLVKGEGLNAWRKPTGEWLVAGDLSLKPGDVRRFAWQPGTESIVNGARGRTRNILTKLEHGDCEAHVEFVVPQGSNSGVYFMGRYEIQVLDSGDDEQGGPKENPQHGDCGGIYQRWINGRGFEGRPPRVNAARKYGQWQTFDVVFLAPRFETSGKKVANATFVKVVHNGIVVHENQEVTGPTRAATYNDEKPLGPLMLQGDHGPVAYRTIRIRPLALVPEATYEAIKTYEQGKSRKALAALEEATRSARPGDLPGIEAGLLDVRQEAGSHGTVCAPAPSRARGGCDPSKSTREARGRAEDRRHRFDRRAP